MEDACVPWLRSRSKMVSVSSPKKGIASNQTHFHSLDELCISGSLLMSIEKKSVICVYLRHSASLQSRLLPISNEAWDIFMWVKFEQA